MFFHIFSYIAYISSYASRQVENFDFFKLNQVLLTPNGNEIVGYFKNIFIFKFLFKKLYLFI